MITLNYDKYLMSTEYLDENLDLLRLDLPRIQEHFKASKIEKYSSLPEIILPTKLETYLIDAVRDSKYCVIKVSKDVCERLKISMYHNSLKATNIVIKTEDFEEIKQIIENIEVYRSFEPLNLRQYQQGYSKNVSNPNARSSDELPEFLEKQVISFLESKGRDYFVNRAVKDIAEDLKIYAVKTFGTNAYSDRRLKNARLAQILKDKYNLEAVERKMQDEEDLKIYHRRNNEVGKSTKFFEEVK